MRTVRIAAAVAPAVTLAAKNGPRLMWTSWPAIVPIFILSSCESPAILPPRDTLPEPCGQERVLVAFFFDVVILFFDVLIRRPVGIAGSVVNTTGSAIAPTTAHSASTRPKPYHWL